MTYTVPPHERTSSPNVPQMFPVEHQPLPESPGLRALQLALRVSRVHHTMSMAQLVGIYPA